MTVYPFIFISRGLNGLIKEQGNIGPYEETIQNIKEVSSVKVPTEGILIWN